MSHDHIFGRIVKIEQQADDLLEKARAEAAEIRSRAEAGAAEAARATDREIEGKKNELADEYKARTEQALARIDVEHLKREETLKTVREERFEELVAWTVDRLLDRQPEPKPHGD